MISSEVLSGAGTGHRHVEPYLADRWILGAILLVLLGAIHLNPLIGSGMLALLLISWTAWYFPIFTLVLTVVLGQIVQHEIAPVLGLPTEGLGMGGVNIRLSDLPLAGIAGVTLLRFLKGEHQTRALMSGASVLLLAYFAFQIFRNLGTFGISALGEFRTYWHVLLLVPYVAINSDTPERRITIMKTLILLAFSNLLWAVLRGGVLYGFGFSAYDKWLSSFGSLSLVFGALAFVLLRRTGAILAGPWLAGMITSLVASVLVIAGSRSAWLVGIVGGILVARSRITIRNAGFVSLVILLSGGLLIIPFSISGIDPIRFLTERLLALTDFQQDPTSAWRYYFWISSVETISKQPWLGTGFGPHFDIFVPELNEVFTTSPHNLYLTILSQTGILGLFLYVWWVIGIGRRCRTVSTGSIDQAIARLSFITLIGLHLYALAFSFEKDFTSWAIVGVGLAASIYPRNQKKIPELRE
ncbi:MAG: O-antigen ligase family protein [Ignavibacteria bacterium]|nr:O-antigen ligase family protein [Ignavibacteria bacterium]